METKVCIRCKVEKSIEEFPYKSYLRGTRQTVCKVCTAQRSREWYADNKERQTENVRINRGNDVKWPENTPGITSQRIHARDTYQTAHDGKNWIPPF